MKSKPMAPNNLATCEFSDDVVLLGAGKSLHGFVSRIKIIGGKRIVDIKMIVGKDDWGHPIIRTDQWILPKRVRVA